MNARVCAIAIPLLVMSTGCPDRPGSASMESNTSAGLQSCDDIVASGNGAGQIPDDFSLRNGAGDDETLHQHCGSVIVLVMGAAW